MFNLVLCLKFLSFSLKVSKLSSIIYFNKNLIRIRFVIFIIFKKKSFAHKCRVPIKIITKKNFDYTARALGTTITPRKPHICTLYIQYKHCNYVHK